ncbi:hypothetical protein KIP69_11725 [Geobacter sulfurreducens]|jgi:hypothetical protein|uniref:Metanogen output domain-containing protein n=1 Tax=Geobacter sulfurreducens (strain ATCC 51573 / DSM 12127 / PCA) TaxID=243231 RepID=Q74AF5_GEOSL|nr:hypothetical protein [Geobacter sulfurreducens]BET57510.1 hypothetical protein GEO60473_05500 [Geobacter sp. 60473]AAR35794.1 hypothetical protein GSU2421 [Geobacter sulfurreducens PCA]ADI85181.1 hypothetical protein KN400_2369 [Geobacter sulfurreducens KN400]AJY68652.1 hypothetical protein RW64_03095 [Geobacter sulfurreducens]QVW34259.1 hypothetical protein KIP69_11725 [Geobacter sulfurreducens]
MSAITEQVTLDDHVNAATEVAFLLDIFAATVDNVMGGATASVGRIAGREMARKLPVHLTNPTLDEVVAILNSRMEAGYRFRLEGDGTERTLLFDHCVLREVCAKRGLTMGTALCRLFHAYLDGILNELICRPVKSEVVSCGDQCRLNLRTQ